MLIHNQAFLLKKCNDLKLKIRS